MLYKLSINISWLSMV